MAGYPSEEMEEKVSSQPPLRQGACGVCGIKNKEAGWSEAWRAWANVIGKKWSNHCSAQE